MLGLGGDLRTTVPTPTRRDRTRKSLHGRQIPFRVSQSGQDLESPGSPQDQIHGYEMTMADDEQRWIVANQKGVIIETVPLALTVQALGSRGLWEPIKCVRANGRPHIHLDGGVRQW